MVAEIHVEDVYPAVSASAFRLLYPATAMLYNIWFKL